MFIISKKIALHMIDVLNELDHKIVWYGDLAAIEECAKRSGLYETIYHPLNIINRVLSALDRCPDLFTKGYIKHVGRPARSFTIREK